MVTNPLNFAIGAPSAQADGVTAVEIHVGTTAGGPYTAHTYPLTAAEVSAGLAAGGNFSGTLVSVGEALGPGTYFGVSVVKNATGVSGNSPEASFQVQAAPSPPVSFTVA